MFEIGSLICAVAPSMNVLIFGRAIQGPYRHYYLNYRILTACKLTGIGGSGCNVAIMTIIAQIAHLDIRPVLLGSIDAIFGFASVIGPILGGMDIQSCQKFTYL
jgi:MFS family permease